MATVKSNGKSNGKPTAMTWTASQKRWIKMYRGRMYSVSCRQLKVEGTKEASRIPANEWWDKKRRAIDEELGEAKKHPIAVVEVYKQAMEHHRLFAKWQRKYGNDAEAALKSEAMIEFLTEALKGDNPPFPLKRFMESPLWEVWDCRDDYEVKAWSVWNERIQQIRREEKEEKSVPREDTIRAHIDDYLEFRKSKVAAGKNTLGTYDTYRARLNVFKEWVPPYAPVASLDETLWDKYYTYLASQCEKGTLSHSTAGSTLNAAREFIRSRHKKRVIEEPRNLGDYAISPRLKTIEVFTIDEVKTLLAHCHTDRDTLFILLSLNCGMYGVDMAKLTKEQYQNGHIIRKRSKTENRSVNVPCVDYPLWDLTDTILRKEMSEHPTLVLVNNNGEPLWTEQEKEGKFVRNNNVKCAISRIKDRAGITKPTKCLRKTSASLLGGHAEYGRYAEYFLGESPTSMADRHYVKPNDEQFGRAIHWLGQQYGMGCQWISIARRGNRCQ